ncbi:hypothetical protein JKY72_02320 [Candidatus Gracilibacteria bacterium]|nr:hypothetical protein [Candidatus Gracilibacteria bacterium]
MKLLEEPAGEFENLSICWRKAHELGIFEIKKGDKLPNLNKEELNILMGYVDKHQFNYKREKIFPVEGDKKMNSYAHMTVAAKDMVKFWPYLQLKFPTLKYKGKREHILKLVTKIAGMKTFTDKDWHKAFKDMGYDSKSEIAKYITGREGVYQLILAYQRAVSPLHDKLKLSDLKMKDGKDHPKVAIVLGITSDVRASKVGTAKMGAAKAATQKAPPVKTATQKLKTAFQNYSEG